MAVDGTVRRYVDEPPHLLGMRENEPLHIPTADEYFAATGRVLIAEDFHQYFTDTPFNLEDGPPPAVLGSFTWSGLYIDNLINIDLSAYFTQAQITGSLPYRAWRVRGLWRGGYMLAYYGTNPPSRTPSGEILSVGQGGTGFRVVTGGWALGHDNTYGDMIQQIPYGSENYYFTGGPPGRPIDLWFKIKFQVEVGYGHPLDNTATRLTAGRDWPAYSGVTTDLDQIRGYNPAFACFNGLANAPGLVGCPFTDGSYTPPDPPEDL